MRWPPDCAGSHGRRRRVRRCGRLERIGVNDYDVVVLDRDLPLVHGDDVCRKIVELGMPTRVLMLTASGDVSDRVEGLEIGADDYLPKPFAFSS